MKFRKLRTATAAFLFLSTTNIFSQDPNFHIYLCFGQSNMEGQGTIELQDKTVDSRLQVMEAVECSNLGRTKGSWYTAVPPLVRCYTGLSPADYFGRTMVENLPDSIKVGIINVSVAGCKIELFNKDTYQDYVSSITEDWLLNIINSYNGNPYTYLVELAQLAQVDGVIKGILMHQGESNTNDTEWPSKVKTVYDNLITDLGLNADVVPFFAGEVVNADQDGVCASMNTIIATLPETLPNSYVISSAGCTDAADNLHFNSAGYRKLGARYAIKALSLVGIEASEPEDVESPVGTESVYLEAECGTVGANWDILADSKASNGTYAVVKSGIQSLTEAAGAEGTITLPFSIDTTGEFNVFARLNCATADDDSYWINMDNASFMMVNGLATSGWQWKLLNTYNLTKGEHSFSITYREDGGKIDKICVSNYTDAPTGTGEHAEILCDPAVGIKLTKNSNSYALDQNYPNPFNGLTNISFNIPQQTYVSLKVYSIIGEEIAEIAGKDYKSGNHTLPFNAANLTTGIYFYTLKTENFTSSRKMIVQPQK